MEKRYRGACQACRRSRAAETIECIFARATVSLFIGRPENVPKAADPHVLFKDQAGGPIMSRPLPFSVSARSVGTVTSFSDTGPLEFAAEAEPVPGRVEALTPRSFARTG